MATRECVTEIAVGTTGVGKTYKNKVLIDLYFAKHNRPVLIFDVNLEYSEYKTIDFDCNESDEQIRCLEIMKFTMSSPHIRRIVALRQDGTPMSISEMKQTFFDIAKYFVNGLLVLEDINRYDTNMRGQTAKGIISTLRHRGLDILISFQSISDIPDNLWRTSKYIRIHKNSDDPYNKKNRISNIFIIEIAYLIVQHRYSQSFNYLKSIGISFDNYRNNRNKFIQHQQKADGIFSNVYVQINPPLILNVPELEFKEAVKIFYQKYNNNQISQIVNYKKCNRDEALEILANDSLEYLHNKRK